MDFDLEFSLLAGFLQYLETTVTDRWGSGDVFGYADGPGVDGCRYTRRMEDGFLVLGSRLWVKFFLILAQKGGAVNFCGGMSVTGAVSIFRLRSSWLRT